MFLSHKIESGWTLDSVLVQWEKLFTPRFSVRITFT